MAYLVALAAAALVVTLVMVGTKRPPFVPRDADHASVRRTEGCLGDCHGPKGTHPRTPKHPIRTDCWSCHAWAAPRR